MKIFANRRNIWKKIVIIFSLIFSMSFVEPAPVEASIGGTLMEPICDFLVGIGDGIMGITQNVIIGQESSLIRVNLNTTLKQVVRMIVTGLVLVLVLTAAVLITGGGVLLAGAVAAKLSLVAAVVKAGVIISAIVPTLVAGRYFGAMAYNNDYFVDEIVLPMYSLSPEKIFANTYPFFDVNFFNPNTQAFEYEWVHKYTAEDGEDTANGKYIQLSQEDNSLTFDWSKGTDVTTEVNNDFSSVSNAKVTKAIQIEVNGTKYVKYTISVPSGEAGYTDYERIRKINDGTSSESASSSSGTEKKWAFTKELQSAIKFWYGIMRTLAIVGMMSVLVYIGIRILLSSTAEQKSKYKQLLGDWLVGMVLLFTMQYIMVFANIAVDHLTDLFKNINPMGQVAFVPDNKGKVKEELSQWNIEVVEANKNNSENSENSEQNAEQSTSGSSNMEVYRFTDKAGDTYIEWHTDLMGQLRIALQANREASEKYIGYTIMFLVMVIYTGIFCYIYIKRVIYMAFLTIISPLVALTYPIDKVNDGSAQGFNYWFKEYIFNLLLQPIHLLIYTILVSSAIKLASSNIIYSLVALGFITQAEKIVRTMFNFSKASTPGVFSGPAGAAMAMTGMRWLLGRGPNGPNGGGGAHGASGGANTSGNSGRILKTENDTEKSDAIMAGILGSEEVGEQAMNAGEQAANIRENLTKMREAELEETPYIPDNEQLQMWNNDANLINDDGGMNYDDDEYRQILIDSGATEEEIAEIMGTTSNDGISGSVDSSEASSNVGTSDVHVISTSEGATQDQPTDADSTETENVQRRGIINKIANSRGFKAAGATLSEYGEGMSYKIAQSIYNARPGRAIGKAVGAITFGTMGAAMGIASGDMKSVVTDTAALGAAGSKLGSGIVDSVSGALRVDGIDETFAKAYYGDDKIAQENRERMALQKEWIETIMEKENLSKTAAKKRAIELSEYIKYGYKDAGEIIKMDKYREQKSFRKADGNIEPMSVAEVSKLNDLIKKYEINKMNGQQEKDKRVKQFAQDYGKNETEAVRMIDMTRDLYNFMND